MTKKSMMIVLALLALVCAIFLLVCQLNAMTVVPRLMGKAVLV